VNLPGRDLAETQFLRTYLLPDESEAVDDDA
jgi:hypothetical protein